MSYQDKERSFEDLLWMDATVWLTEEILSAFPREVEKLKAKNHYDMDAHAAYMYALNRLFVRGMAQVKYSQEEAVRFAQRLEAFGGTGY